MRSISFKIVDVKFDATLHTIFKSPYLIKFHPLRNMNVFNRFHYNPSCGSLDFPVKALNILHKSIYYLLWNVEDCIVNFFCTVCFYQFIRVGLRNCTRIKGVHGVEAEQQEKELILTEYLWHLAMKQDPQRHQSDVTRLFLFLLNIIMKLRLLAREPGLHLSLDYRVIIGADLRTERVKKVKGSQCCSFKPH